MASMNEKDYYAVLGVDSGATTDEIRKAFQQKARKLHPDVNKEPDAEERFKEVSEAYAVLSDEDKRRRYDAMRSGSPFGGAAAGYGSPAGTTGSYGDPFDWGFPFGGAYTGRRTTTASRSYNPKTGSDIAYNVTLDDAAAEQGTRRGVSYQRYETCSACHGHGSVSHTHPVTCPTCGGTGHMTIDLSGIFAMGVLNVTCPECEGTGKVVEDPCTSCGGSGRVLTASEVVVDIPAGTHDGDVIRVAGMGNAGTNGKSSGDFICRVELPSERLSEQQAMGASLMGFGLPFVLMGLFGGENGYGLALIILGSVLAAVGVGMLVQEGVRANKRWLSHAASVFGTGALRGVIGAFVLPFVISSLPWLLSMIVLSVFLTWMMRRL